MKIGISTAVTNASQLKPVGAEFIEEHIQNFFVGEATDEIFLPKLEASRASVLPVIAGNCFLPGKMRCVGTGIDVDEILRYAANVFERAARVGCKIMVFGSGGARQIPDGFSKATALEQFISLSKKLAPLAEKHGVLLVIEPLNKAECNFINSLSEGAAVVTGCNHPHVQLLADIYHMLRDGEGPEEIKRHGTLLRHIHIAEREKRSAPGVMGDDFSPYLKALRQIDYKGDICIEAIWKDFLPEATLGIRNLKKQLQDAGFDPH